MWGHLKELLAGLFKDGSNGNPDKDLGRKDPLEGKMATHSSILAWEISWTEEPGGP